MSERLDQDPGLAETGIAAARPNPVHAFRHALQTAFSRPAAAAPEELPNGPYEAALRRLLREVGWRGTEDQLAELMPYLDRMETLAQLLAVMHHLGYRCGDRMLSAAPTEMRAFPAIAELEPGRPIIILGQLADGSYRYLPIEAGAGTDAPGEPLILHLGKRKLDSFNFQMPERDVDDPQWKKNWYLSAISSKASAYYVIIFMSFVINVLGLFVPIYVSMMYNYMIPTRSMDTILYMFVLGGLVVGLEIFLKQQRSRIVAHAGSHFVTVISTATFAKLLDLPLSMTQSAPISAQIARLRQFSNVKDFFSGQLASTAFDLPFTAVFLIAMIMMGGALAWIPVILVGVLGLIVTLFKMRLAQATDEASLTGSRLQAFQFESLDLRQLIREHAVVDRWRSRYGMRLRDALQARYRTGLYSFALHTIAQMMVMLAGVVTLVVGAGMVMDGSLSSGALIACMMIVWRLLSPIQIALLGMDRILQFAKIIRQINAMMRLEPESAGTGRGTHLRRAPLSYTLTNVSLRYPRAATLALRGVSLEIPAGEALAVAGATSSGKSSLLKICLGLWYTQSGNVLIDGADLRQIEPRMLRKSIGYVPQYLQFIHGTLRDNLSLGTPSATEGDLQRAIEMTGVARYSGYFPRGLDTRLTGDEWTTLPNGVRQLVALARAAARDVPIYLLDEPGTFIDADGEAYFKETFEHMKRKATVIMATNRPSHMSLCDRVVFLAQGTVAADGTPEEIIAAIQAKAKNSA